MNYFFYVIFVFLLFSTLAAHEPLCHKPKATTWLKHFAEELFCCTKTVITRAGFALTDLSGKEKKPTSKTAHPPILLIHGHLNNSSVWRFHKRELEKEGFTVFTVNLGSPFKGIDDCAYNEVSEKVRQIQEWTGRKDLSLVGHSMGGLVASYYAVHCAPKDGAMIKQIITLGSPLQGTKVAHITSCTKQAKQMLPGSSFIQELQTCLAGQDEIEFFTISSQSDLIIRPTCSAQLPTASRTHEFELMGHVSYLYSKEVSKLLIEELR